MDKIKIVLDTNLLLLLQRNADFAPFLETTYPFTAYEYIVPFATHGEVASFALRNNWGDRRKNYLTEFLKRVVKVEVVSEEMVMAYAEIEAYSLCQHPTLKKPEGETAHRMGKNDLWIAATTLVHAERIVTTDKDFIQLDGVFFEVDYIDISEFT